MKNSIFIKVVIFLIILISFSGCAYRYTEDYECLECHHPDKDPEGPPTTHPNFTGCLKCHNDDIKTR